MPGINVSALSGGDLRRLLKVAHARRDGLLADRLEWEIAARATSGGRPPGAFADPPRDDEDEPVERIVAPGPDAGSFAAEPSPGAAAQPPGGVLLVTLGAVAGSLLSAALFWSLERYDLRQGRAAPATAVTTSPAAAPSVTPPPARIETTLPVATPPAQVARTPPKRRVPAAAKPKAMTVAAAEHAPRPPNLAEWLAGAEPEEPIH